MKKKLITILKATGIMVSFIIAALIIIALCRMSNYLSLSFVIAAVLYGIYFFYRMMRPKERYYFVSYSHGGCFGSGIARVKGVFLVTEISKSISDSQFGGEATVTILYYKEISEEEYKGNQS